MPSCDEIREEIKSLLPTGSPRVIEMLGENPLSPNAPTRGIYKVGSWSCTTQHISYELQPEGWDVLVEREASGETLEPFLIFWTEYGDGYCIPAVGDHFRAFYTISDRVIDDLVDYCKYLSDEDGW